VDPNGRPTRERVTPGAPIAFADRVKHLVEILTVAQE
jgi:hypothetical protein